MAFATRFILSLLLCAAGLSSASAAHALEDVTLQLKWHHQFQFAGYYAAKEQGYYRDAGLDVHFTEATPDTDVIQQVLDGHAQFGIGTSSLLLARSKGMPVVNLAVIFQHSPYAIFTAKNTGIEHLHDLLGKTIMLEPQSEELSAYLKKEAAPIERLILKQHSFNPQDLISGKVAAISGYVTSEPYFFQQAGFSYQEFSPRSVGIDFYGDNLFTSEQELQEHPEQVRAFREASLRGWLYAKEHRDEIINLILTQYSKKHIREYLRFEADQMIPLLQPDFIEIGYSNPQRWQQIANTYADLGILPHKVSLDGFIYNQHLVDHSWLYRVLGIALCIILLTAALANQIFKFNRKLKDNLKALELLNEQERALSQALELMSEGAALNEVLNAVITSVEIQDPDCLCSILLVDTDTKHLRINAAPHLPPFFMTAIDDQVIGPQSTPCGKTAYTGKRTIIENIAMSPRLTEFKSVAEKANLNSCWSEPIRASNDVILGTFAIYHHQAYRPTEDSIRVIEKAAHLASIAIEKNNDALALKNSHTLLSKISAEVPGIIFQFKMDPNGHCSFPFISETVRKFYGVTPEDVREDATPIFQFQFPEDSARISASIQESARKLTPWHIEYRVLLPVAGLRWRLGNAHPERMPDGSILWHGFITDITNRKIAEERILHMAQYDALTELPNRGFLSDRLQQALAVAKREQTHLALMFLDFDKFKPINDTLGHAIGDILLKQAAVRMQTCLRESDTLARIGGDEFVVLLPHVENDEDAMLVAEKVRQAMNKPFEVEGNQLNISSSIGIAIYPDHGENEIQLSKNADLAMYYAKQNGRNFVMVFHHEMKTIGGQ